MTRQAGVALNVDGLECRALLSGISYTLTTDQPVYRVGQSIQFTFTETNTSDQSATISLSPTDFSVLNPYGVTWQSNPENADQPAKSVTLQPGQSVSQTATWDGTMTETVILQGTATSAAINQWGTFLVSNPNAPQGDTATLQISDPLQGALTTDFLTYQLGQPVQMTYTETNTTDQTLTFFTPSYNFQAWHHGQQVILHIFDPLPIVGPSDAETLAPGQAITEQYTWNGLPYIGPYTLANLTGAFVATISSTATISPAASATDPNGASADFQIAPPPAGTIVSSVTTDQPTYQDGQTVTMTFTETNQGDCPVAVPTGSDGFEFGSDGVMTGSVPNQGPTPLGPTWAILNPGWSLTQTATWPVGHPVSGPYHLTITNIYDLNGNTATFEEIARPTPTGNPPGLGSPGSGAGSPVTGQVAPLISSVVTTRHAEYKVGESVRIRTRIPVAGAAKVPSPRHRAREQITVLDGSQI